MTLSIRVAASMEDGDAIFSLLLEQHAEVGRAPLAPGKALSAVYQTITGGCAFMVFDGEDLVATMGIDKTDHWYSDAEFLFERWLYAKPDARHAGAMRLLLREAAALCDQLGLELIIDHPTLRRRPGLMETVAYRLAYQPAGTLIAVTPKGA